ncbi:MAG: hypothetical protein MO846_00135 [Candidatus Devosia symbiotica]|nr:hypothetical protein [Candidatus Devosia symbiotica]
MQIFDLGHDILPALGQGRAGQGDDCKQGGGKDCVARIGSGTVGPQI